METLHPCCAGLDVHKDTIVACVRRVSPGGQVRKQVRTFGTMTVQLLELVDWLVGEGVTHAAVESTGVYWKPAFSLLEGQVQVILVNHGAEPFTVQTGDRIAQLVIAAVAQPEIVVVEALDETPRGAGGFGSTG